MKIFRAWPLAVLFFAGCAGYHIGPIKPTVMQGVETIHVPTFRNLTLEPRIEVLVASTVIKQIQQDGTYRIAREQEADVVLEGTIEKIERRSARSVRGDVLATKEFELELALRYKLYRRQTGEVLTNGSVTGTSSFFVSDDLQQDERQAIPLAAEQAAVRLVSTLSEGW